MIHEMAVPMHHIWMYGQISRMVSCVKPFGDVTLVRSFCLNILILCKWDLMPDSRNLRNAAERAVFNSLLTYVVAISCR